MPIPDAQQDVARFLTSLAGSEPKETHISAIFTGKDTVWKLKKAVRLPFLDFSESAVRQHFLRRELELNKPPAPDLYRDVVPINRASDGAITLAGPGESIDWVLRMARIPEEDFFDVIATQGRLTPASLDALGDCVAAYHARLEPVREWDSDSALRRVIETNAESALAAGLSRQAVDDWQERVQAEEADCRPWLAERVAGGFVRRCHGDLHLGNLCLWHGVPTPFDALEFDEALATIDIGFDLAFLLMDLDCRVGRAVGNRVMNRVLARNGDFSSVRGLKLFLSLRAMIRAHVAATSGGHESAAEYLAAALDYLVPSPACVLAIGGLQGTGKSTLARQMAPAIGPAPGAVVLRSDEIRKRLHGSAPEDRLPPSAYDEAANEAVNQALMEQADAVLRAGHAVVVDATFLSASLRHSVEQVAQSRSVFFAGVWLDAPLAVLEKRVTERHHDASDATVEVLRRSTAAQSGAIGWLRVDALRLEQAPALIRQAFGVHNNIFKKFPIP